jgi:hypothetical protein
MYHWHILDRFCYCDGGLEVEVNWIFIAHLQGKAIVDCDVIRCTCPGRSGFAPFGESIFFFDWKRKTGKLAPSRGYGAESLFLYEGKSVCNMILKQMHKTREFIKSYAAKKT